MYPCSLIYPVYIFLAPYGKFLPRKPSQKLVSGSWWYYSFTNVQKYSSPLTSINSSRLMLPYMSFFPFLFLPLTFLHIWDSAGSGGSSRRTLVVVQVNSHLDKPPGSPPCDFPTPHPPTQCPPPPPPPPSSPLPKAYTTGWADWYKIWYC